MNYKKSKIAKETSKKKIMIIEDELDILSLFKDYLGSKGYEVLATSTVANGILDEYDGLLPDILILDYKLPGEINGLDAARIILQKHSDAHIILITAYDVIRKEINKDPFLSNKQIFLLIKPIRLHELENYIKKFFPT